MYTCRVSEKPKNPSNPGGLKTGVQAVVEMMQHMDGPSREKLMANLQERDPHLVAELEKRLWTFEDLKKLEAADLQLLLREVPSKTLALALRKTSEEVKQAIFSNISKRAGQVLQEDVMALGPQKLSKVEEAQAEIGKKLRALIEAGKFSK